MHLSCKYQTGQIAHVAPSATPDVQMEVAGRDT